MFFVILCKTDLPILAGRCYEQVHFNVQINSLMCIYMANQINVPIYSLRMYNAGLCDLTFSLARNKF
jgi:hypothetical protein